MLVRVSSHGFFPRRPRPWLASILCVLLIPCLFVCNFALADCLPEAPSLQEQFSMSPVVLRLALNPSTETRELPCGIEIYEGQNGYVLEDKGFSSYTILEVLKQNWSDILDPDLLMEMGMGQENSGPTNPPNSSTTGPVSTAKASTTQLSASAALLQPGMSVPVIHSTDTGFYKALPEWLTSDPNGFLAFLTPYRYCVEPLVDSNNFESASIQAFPYANNNIPTSDNNHAVERAELVAASMVQENPYLLSECDTSNQPWSSLSEDKVKFLHSQNGYIAALSTTTEESNTTAVEEMPVVTNSSVYEIEKEDPVPALQGDTEGELIATDEIDEEDRLSPIGNDLSQVRSSAAVLFKTSSFLPLGALLLLLF